MGNRDESRGEKKEGKAFVYVSIGDVETPNYFGYFGDEFSASEASLLVLPRKVAFD